MLTLALAFESQFHPHTILQNQFFVSKEKVLSLQVCIFSYWQNQLAGGTSDFFQND